MSDCPVCHMPAPQHHMSCYAPRVTERRFRDMSLTESEAWEMAQQHWGTVGGSYPDGAFDVFEERCGRLLPLWRKWGLEELSGNKASVGTMTDRDAVCWHCLDCVTVPARTRCEHCPEECDIEGCDAPGCNGQVATVSPWRSLRDDPPTGKGAVIVARARDAGRHNFLNSDLASLGFTYRLNVDFPDAASTLLALDFEEWMEVPS